MQFTLTIEHKHGIIEELRLRAWQERAVKDVGRTTKSYRAGCERAAVALENLARDIGKWQVRDAPEQGQPVSPKIIVDSIVPDAERDYEAAFDELVGKYKSVFNTDLQTMIKRMREED